MHSLSFEYPLALILLVIIPISFYIAKKLEIKKDVNGAKFSRLELLAKAAQDNSDKKKLILTCLYVFAVFTGVLAIARPQILTKVPENSTKLMLAFDISLSMQADDMYPNRLFTARDAAIEFIKNLPENTKAGLEYFYGNAYIAVNPTFEKEAVIKKLSRLNLNSLQPGTAIGTALDGALNSLSENGNLKNSSTIILLTDGESNQGTSPLAVAKTARKNGIKIFTIGIGKPEGAIVKGYRTYLDQGTLMEIANITGAKYFHANSHKELRQIYKELRNKAISFENQKVEITFLFSGLSFIAFLVLIYLGISVFNPVF